MSKTETPEVAPDATPDELPKRKVARKVVAQKRRYFSPSHGRSVEAASQEEAVKLLNKKSKTQEEGDD